MDAGSGVRGLRFATAGLWCPELIAPPSDWEMVRHRDGGILSDLGFRAFGLMVGTRRQRGKT
ncbi:MAG: hypothetical protein OXC19_10140 [Bryobacterales bacterium]|nr:hypothetical protein [Bryobacterales bacterium]